MEVSDLGVLAGLSENEAAPYEHVVDEFEVSWVAGQQPDIQDFWPQDGLRSDVLLEALLLSDMEFRSKTRLSFSTSEYLEQIPTLTSFAQVIATIKRWEMELVSAVDTAQVHEGNFHTPSDGLNYATAEPSVPYDILCLLGEGGMGRVFKATDRSLGRTVALKQVHGGVLATKNAKRRLIREAQNASLLDHPNIVQIFEAGNIQGEVYIAMQFIDGKDLRKALCDNSLERREIVQCLHQVVSAMAFAHSREVLHCDLKPGNILIDESGIAYVIDFGLSRHLDPDDTVRASYTLAGTRQYAAPEVLSCNSPSTTLSDIYSFGATLYHAITGQFPHQEHEGRFMKARVTVEPVSASQIAHRLPRDLEVIVMKCLELLPEHRFQSFDEIEKELGRFLAGMPIVSRPISKLQRWRRWTARNWVVSLLASLLVILLCGTLTMNSRHLSRSMAKEQETRMELAAKWYEDGDIVQAMSWLEPELKHTDWGKQITSAATSEIGHRVFSKFDPRLVVFGNDKTAALDNNRNLIVLEHGATIKITNDDYAGIAVNEDFSKIWCASKQGRIVEVDTVAGKAKSLLTITGLKHDSECLKFHSAPNGRRLLFETQRNLFLVDPSNESVLQLNAGQGYFLGSQNKLLIVNGQRLKIFAWDSNEYTSEFALQQNHYVTSWAFSERNSMLAIGHRQRRRNGHISLFSTRTGEVEELRSVHHAGIGRIEFLGKQEEILVSGDNNGRVIARSLNPQSSNQWTLTAEGPVIASIARNRASGRIAIADRGGNVQIHDVDSEGHPWLQDRYRLNSSVSNISFGKKRLLVRLSHEVRDLPLKRIDRREFDHRCQSIEFHPNEDCCAFAFSNDAEKEITIRFMNSQFKDEVFKSIKLDNSTSAERLNFSTDGNKIIVSGKSSEGSYVSIWDYRNNERLFHRQSTEPIVQTATPDGEYHLIGSYRKGLQICLASAKHDELISNIDFDIPKDARFAFHPTQSYAAIAGQDSNITIVDWKQGRIVSTLSINQPNIYNLEFTKGGQNLALGLDGRVEIWDWQRKQLSSSLPHHGKVYGLCFSEDGLTLHSSSLTGYCYTWDVETGCRLKQLELKQHGRGSFAVDIAINEKSNCLLVPLGQIAKPHSMISLSLPAKIE